MQETVDPVGICWAAEQTHSLPAAEPGVTPDGNVAVMVIGSFSAPPDVVTPACRV